jgi:hypothetical protein
MGIDAILAIGTLILPPAIDFIKKKFLKREQDSPEATMSTLATTKPDVLPAYVTAITGWIEAQVKFFQRDISGTPSQWVVDLRAVIRPVGTIGAGVVLGVMVYAAIIGYKPDPSMIDTLTGVRYSCEVIVSSWFGDRIVISRGIS